MAKLIARMSNIFSMESPMRGAVAAQHLSDAELADRGMKRTDIAREIMINGSWG
ncbi:MAG: hypothetical protein ACFB11_15470 [Paracoccaceae bacterium]